VEPIGRREFVRRIALAGVSAPLAGAILAACRSASPSVAARPTGEPLPIDPSLAVPSGQPIERGATLRVYEWKEYLSRRVLDSFEDAYASAGIRVEVESFLTIDEAVARLQRPSTDFDVFFPTIDVLPSLVRAGLLRPLNHDYLPHLDNLWGWFRAGDGPFYDRGQRYTTPYTVYSSGIGWRADRVRPGDAPDERAVPYDVLWDPTYRGRIGMYDDYVEALALALQREGVGDLRGASASEVADAADALEEAVRTAGLRFTIDGAQEGLSEEGFAAHQAWSGDVLSAARYVREEDGGYAADAVARELRYWSPPGATKVVGCDLTAVCARGRNPVLAHAFLDHLLRFEVALDNFAWNGYQVPMDDAEPDAFADPAFGWHDAVPATLLPGLLTEEDFARGQWLVGFAPSQTSAWLDQWNRVAPAT
jgi:spermidine/putrescine transport system substrate-binding protein